MKKKLGINQRQSSPKRKNRLSPILFQPFFAHTTFMAFIGTGEEKGKLGEEANEI
jgi:hypothetical protein